MLSDWTGRRDVRNEFGSRRVGAALLWQMSWVWRYLPGAPREVKSDCGVGRTRGHSAPDYKRAADEP